MSANSSALFTMGPALAAARRQLLQLISSGGAGGFAASAAWAATMLPAAPLHRFASAAGASSEGGAETAGAASTSGRGSASASPPPHRSGPPAPRPAFVSGARLVQPLQRGGLQVQTQEGVVHINCSLNNTHVVLTDLEGQVKTYTSGGSVGFKNAGKSTPLAAERAAAELAKRALAKGFYSVSVRLKGMGRNKQIAVQALAAAGISVTQLREVTPTPYNGCRLPRKRRV